MQFRKLLFQNILFIGALAYLDLPLKSNKRLAKRDNNPVELDLTNVDALYTTNLKIGTPPQELTLIIDTGSSDFWVMSSEVNCTINQELDPGETCHADGLFDYTKSSTFQDNNTYFLIDYADNSYASGKWAKDVVEINGVNVGDFVFGVANASNNTAGIIGTGFIENESGDIIVTKNGTKEVPVTYPNFPVQLKNQGVINRIAYSLFLSSAKGKHGSLLFGAVDHSKYTGSLYTLPMVNPLENATATEFYITLFGLGYSDQNETSTIVTTSIPVLLDSGSSVLVLPEYLLTPLAASVNANFNETDGSYVMDCDIPKGASLIFDFGGFQISIPLEDAMVVDDNNICTLNAVNSPDFTILGESFMRNAYTVYDLESREISIAQANLNGTNSDNAKIEEIVSTVPSATKAPLYSTPYVAGEGVVSVGGSLFTSASRASTNSKGVSVTATSVPTNTSVGATNSTDDVFTTSLSLNNGSNFGVLSFQSLIWSLIIFLL